MEETLDLFCQSKLDGSGMAATAAKQDLGDGKISSLWVTAADLESACRENILKPADESVNKKQQVAHALLTDDLTVYLMQMFSCSGCRAPQL